MIAIMTGSKFHVFILLVCGSKLEADLHNVNPIVFLTKCEIVV